MKHTVTNENDLLGVLRSLFPSSSGATLRKMLTQARVVVNGEVVHRAKHTVHEGDEIEVLERQRAEERTPPPGSAPLVDLDVLYEDDTLLVVNKPHRLLSVATDRLEIDTLHHLRRIHGGERGVAMAFMPSPPRPPLGPLLPTLRPRRHIW